MLHGPCLNPIADQVISSVTFHDSVDSVTFPEIHLTSPFPRILKYLNELIESDLGKILGMNCAVRLFERIFSKVHHHVTGDDVSLYTTDFSGFLVPRDPVQRSHFRDVASSLAALFFEKKLQTFVMFYDSVAFCIRFNRTSCLQKVNLRMLADSLEVLPRSEGNATFIVGTDAPSIGFGWEQANCDDEDVQSEIFPLLDFPSLCFYYATPLAAGQGQSQRRLSS
jgi:hypothetical protein